MVTQIKMRVVIGLAAIALGLIAVFTLFSPSLSVGGVNPKDSSEACTSCHYEAPYYRGWKTSTHGKENVSCLDCHKSPVMNDKACLTCHENYNDSTKAEYRWDWVNYIVRINEHQKEPHIGPVDCKTCHIEHEFQLGTPRPVTKSICLLCHQPYTGPKPAVR